MSIFARVLSYALLAMLSGAVWSAESERRVALVIGNSAYKDSPLANPGNDASDMARALSEMGFKVILRRNANTGAMRNAIREFGQELRRAQVGLFYYAGHGVQIKGNNYLIPVGADIRSEADAEDQSIDANYVLRTMEEAQAKVNIVILDACRNNPYARSFRSASRGLAQMTGTTGTLIAFSTAPGSVAEDGTGRNGLYTQHLLANLRQPDTDILRVFTRTRAGVVKDTGGKQTPWELNSLVGEFYFRPGSQVASAAPSAATIPAPAMDSEASDRAFWESVKDSRNPDELKAYLEQFPNGLFAGLAQARLKSLQTTQVASAAPSIAATHPPPEVGSIAAMTPGSVFRDCDGCPEMVVIPAGSFMMGSPASEERRSGREGPQHLVTISRKFAAGKYEVTFDEWDACVRERGCGHNPTDEGWGRGRRPVINVSWHDAKAYTEWLSRKTGKNYRLLTEAEWEYAARAGTTTAFSTGAAIAPTQANYDATQSYAGSVTSSYRRQTVAVGSFAPNAFGLYDVHGNVWEWTEDCSNANYNGAPTDGSSWTSGDCRWRIFRGASWGDSPGRVRSAGRNDTAPTGRDSAGGFRLARID